MLDTQRESLRRKYLSLGIGELVAAAVFACVAVTFVRPRLPRADDYTALWSALTPLLVILVQAGIYWLMARSWVHRTPMPTAIAHVYYAFRITDIALLVAGLVGMLAWWPESLGTALLVAGVWCFAVLEYVNYFVVRLAYPIGRWFTSVGRRRTPRLMHDVRTSIR